MFALLSNLFFILRSAFVWFVASLFLLNELLELLFPDMRFNGIEVIPVTIGVIALLVAFSTGLPWLDPLLAGLVALNILWSGWSLMQTSFSGLMDEAAAPEDVERIRAVIARHAEGAIEAHDLRTRHSGRLTFIEFHLVVPSEMRVDAAHDICDRIEAALREEVEGASITIHVEPEAKAKHQGIVVL